MEHAKNKFKNYLNHLITGGDHKYMDCMVRMSNKSMADFMYAVIMTNSSIVSTFGIGIYRYTRAQNRYNRVQVRVYITPVMIESFESISGIKLSEPIQVKVNK